MGWRILYIEEAMDVKLYLDNVKVIKDGNEIMLPLSDIHSLIVDNTKTIITIPLILKCSEYNINLVLCNIEHMPQTVFYPLSGNYQAPILLKKQIDWEPNIKSFIHLLVIRYIFFDLYVI